MVTDGETGDVNGDHVPEGFASGVAASAALPTGAAAAFAFSTKALELVGFLEETAVWAESQASEHAAAIATEAAVAARAGRLDQVTLLRDIFGPLPFRPVAVDPSWLAWNAGTVRQLAEGIYQERAFDRIPILADALEEAGCDNEEILQHLRGPGPHVRGCWVLDLLSGRGEGTP